jgi:4-diphosphocytidyl-2-C-methyl-D-erythritol kinase
VAFFLDAVPSIGRGIGEILEPLDLPEFSLVLVLSERHLATARVYGAYDAAMPFENRAVFEYRATEAEKRWHQVTEVAHVASLLENDLEKTSFSIIPNLVTDREILVREGAVAALMSGSGPTLFGLCSSRAGAEALADKMTIRGFKTHVVTVGRGVA